MICPAAVLLATAQSRNASAAFHGKAPNVASWRVPAPEQEADEKID